MEEGGSIVFVLLWVLPYKSRSHILLHESGVLGHTCVHVFIEAQCITVGVLSKLFIYLVVPDP